MKYIAILGFGVVGCGVAEVIAMNEERIAKRLGEDLKVKKILDIHEFPDSPFADLVTTNKEEVFEDPEISIVVETIGGARIAYEYTKMALSAGKTVVTSNKELVSTHGVELMRIAHENNCNYIFEASVGGGIPIIRPLHRCLAANKIERIAGIVNGTTNYILTQMAENGSDFEVALKEAKEKGYAENNPSADIDGIDAQRKIAILSTIAMDGAYVDPTKLFTVGITAITTKDMEYAREMNASIKLLAVFENGDEGAFAYVAPHLVSKDHPLACANGVFNAIMVTGNALGDAMFYGQGAGKMATASAVVGDVMDAAEHQTRNAHVYEWYESEKPVLAPIEEHRISVLLRFPDSVSDDAISEAFPEISCQPCVYEAEGEKAVILGKDGDLNEAKLAIGLENFDEVISVIRIF
ncbi:MAG: homoserine dehydrogenase [Clostridiales bacterium]|nr:homoserine dehydrogenase [Clostridiales bacterium]